MKQYKKFIIIFPILGTVGDSIKNKMDIVASTIGFDTEPLYKKMLPHISLHRPIDTISLEKLKNSVTSIALRLHKTRIRIGGIDHFGSEYVVLPVQATKTAASLWSGIHELVSQFPEYEHGPFDHDNTLHITIAEGFSKYFDSYWSSIKKFCSIEPIDVTIDTIAIYGKSKTGWAEVYNVSLHDT